VKSRPALVSVTKISLLKSSHDDLAYQAVLTVVLHSIPDPFDSDIWQDTLGNHGRINSAAVVLGSRMGASAK
jgi:hypothetical protein